jgi:hypothetical protein
MFLMGSNEFEIPILLCMYKVTVQIICSVNLKDTVMIVLYAVQIRRPL